MSGGSDDDLRPILELLAGRWVLSTLDVLAAGELRRVELKRRLGVSDKVLTETLNRLENAGWVIRSFTAGVPATSMYALGPDMPGLAVIIAALREWSNGTRD